MGKATKVLLAAALALGGAVAVAAPAGAYTDGDYTGNGVRLRKTPYTSDNRVTGLGYPGQGARLWCYRTGSSVSGKPFWDDNTNRRTGKRGYSSETLLTPEIFNHC